MIDFIVNRANIASSIQLIILKTRTAREESHGKQEGNGNQRRGHLEGPTIYMALDLGRHCWTVGMLLPGDRVARLFQIDGGDREALSALIGRQRQMVGDAGTRVVSCYEAGRDGFWLHRWLRDQGIDNRVLDRRAWRCRDGGGA